MIAAGWSGKIKTAATMIALCVMIVFWSSGRFAAISSDVTDFLNGLVVGVISVTTAYSGVEYFVKNWDVLK